MGVEKGGYNGGWRKGVMMEVGRVLMIALSW